MLDKIKIINFGFPDILKESNVQFFFDDIFADTNFPNLGYHCRDNSVKFFIRNMSNNETVFDMDFYIRDSYSSPFRSKTISERHIHLQYIKTCFIYRKQGIASFYINQLINLCADNDIRLITLDAAPSSSDTRKTFNKSELVDFYNGFSTDSVKIEII